MSLGPQQELIKTVSSPRSQFHHVPVLAWQLQYLDLF